jgi:hypothetical protein
LHVKKPFIAFRRLCFYLWQQVNNCITSTILTSLTYYKNKRVRLESAQLRGSLWCFFAAAHKVLPFMNILQSASGAACLLRCKSMANGGTSRPKKWPKLTEHETILFIFSLIYSAPDERFRSADKLSCFLKK